jgi:hypothetical protein
MSPIEALEEYEAEFIRRCELMGLSPRKTQKALLNDPARKALFDSAVMEMARKPNPSLVSSGSFN